MERRREVNIGQATGETVKIGDQQVPTYMCRDCGTHLAGAGADGDGRSAERCQVPDGRRELIATASDAGRGEDPVTTS